MRRKLLIRIPLGLLLAAGLWIGVFFLHRWYEANQSEQELAEVVTELDRTNPGWRWEQIREEYPELPPEERSAELAESLDKLPPATTFDRNRQGDVEQRVWDHPPNHRLSDELSREFQQLWEEDRPIREVAEQIAQRRHVGRKLDLTPDVWSTRIGHVVGHRQAVHSLRLDALLQLETGHSEEALTRVGQVLSVADFLRDEPFLVSQLVRLALIHLGADLLERTLARAEFTADHVRELREQINRVATQDYMVVGLRGERAAMDRLFRNIEEGRIDLRGALESAESRDESVRSLGGWVGNFRYAPVVRHDHAVYLRYLTRAIEICELPLWEREEQLSALPLPEQGIDELLSALMLPGMRKMNEAELRVIARLRSTGLALACELFRLERGRWPESMTDLKGQLPDDLPLDPFTGEEMGFDLVPEGLAVPRSELDPVEGGPYFRLWNPELRGLPPLPEPEPAPDNPTVLVEP